MQTGLCRVYTERNMTLTDTTPGPLTAAKCFMWVMYCLYCLCYRAPSVLAVS